MKDSNVKFGVQPFCAYYLICFAACAMHVIYLITFARFSMTLLTMFNVISITFYLISGVISLKTDVSKHALIWIWLFFAEVDIHALLCTLVQGLSVAFFLLPLMIIPIMAYYLFIYCGQRTTLITSVIMGVLTAVTLAFMNIFIETKGTVYEIANMHVLSRNEIITIRTINIIFTFITLIAFTVIFYMEVVRAIAQLSESNTKLNYIANHDALTGLANRRSLWKFFDDLEESRDHYCIVLGDLDDFKKINDTYGHDCGDIVLKSVAGVILRNMSDNDMACRWGGEEMLIVMRGTRDDCYERLGKIKSEICSLGIVHEEKPVKVTMTFGFADSEEKAQAFKTAEIEIVTSATRSQTHIGIESLISMVDKRLYVGKRNGKNVIIAA